MNYNGNLNNCLRLDPEKEPEGIKYQRYGCSSSNEDVSIVKKNTGYHLLDSKGKEVTPSDCKGILFTENGFPVYPGNPTAAAGAFPLLVIHDNDGNVYNQLAGVVIIPKNIGSSSQYTLVHELAHTYGLTDVIKTDLYKINQTNTKTGETYQNDYASTETNLMTWQQPTGKKIRFREIPIACSNGTVYRDSKGINLGIIQRQIDINYSNNQNGESQWSMLRYYISPESVNRKIFYNQKNGYCSDDERILKNKTKEEYENAKKTIEESENNMYINQNKIYTEVEKNNLTIK